MRSLLAFGKFLLVKLKNSRNPFIGKFFHFIIQLLKLIRNAALKPQYFYECYVAKWIAKFLYFPFQPFASYFKSKDYRFILNVAPSVGHTTLELDNFFRKLHLNELDKKYKYVLIVKNNYIFREFLSLYKHKFHFAAASTLLYHLLLPLFLREKELAIDSGVSRLKWQLYPPSDKRGVCISGKPFHFQFFPLEGNVQVREAYARRLKCADYFPLSIPVSECASLLQKFDLIGKKLCLVHIKTNVMNATAAPTDPTTYLPALKMMQGLGHTLVFVGRERMPPEFAKLGMVNYSESRHASFKNDILFFQACSVALVGGSGIAFLAQCYNKPFLYLNSWHAGLSPFTESSIFVPCLVKKKGGSYLSFEEQNTLYFKLDAMDEQFPYSDYIAQNASGEEILEAAKELLSLAHAPKPRSLLQEKYMSIDQGKGVLEFSMSRISQYFLTQHEALLDRANSL